MGCLKVQYSRFFRSIQGIIFEKDLMNYELLKIIYNFYFLLIVVQYFYTFSTYY